MFRMCNFVKSPCLSKSTWGLLSLCPEAILSPLLKSKSKYNTRPIRWWIIGTKINIKCILCLKDQTWSNHELHDQKKVGFLGLKFLPHIDLPYTNHDNFSHWVHALVGVLAMLGVASVAGRPAVGLVLTRSLSFRQPKWRPEQTLLLPPKKQTGLHWTGISWSLNITNIKYIYNNIYIYNVIIYIYIILYCIVYHHISWTKNPK